MRVEEEGEAYFLGRCGEPYRMGGSIGVMGLLEGLIGISAFYSRRVGVGKIRC
jgi:hypothetical protein